MPEDACCTESADWPAEAVQQLARVARVAAPIGAENRLLFPPDSDHSLGSRVVRVKPAIFTSQEPSFRLLVERERLDGVIISGNDNK